MLHIRADSKCHCWSILGGKVFRKAFHNPTESKTYEILPICQPAVGRQPRVSRPIGISSFVQSKILQHILYCPFLVLFLINWRADNLGAMFCEVGFEIWFEFKGGDESMSMPCSYKRLLRFFLADCWKKGNVLFLIIWSFRGDENIIQYYKMRLFIEQK